MSAKFKQVIENIGDLTSDERALVAHCLISSLEIKHDDSVIEKNLYRMNYKIMQKQDLMIAKRDAKKKVFALIDIMNKEVHCLQ